MFVSTTMFLLSIGLLTLFILSSNCIVYIPNGKMGVLERKWSFSGEAHGLMALNNEPGFVPEVLRGGFHFFLPYQYKVYKKNIPMVPSGEIGYVYSRAGNALTSVQVLAEDLNLSFEDARGFLQGNGQKGPQRAILREGMHYINTALFVVLTRKELFFIELNDIDHIKAMHEKISERNGFLPINISGGNDVVGVVTVHDGPQISGDSIIAPVIANCGLYQNPEAFLKQGGKRGRQQTVLLDGTYYLNSLFATVELINKTTIDVGYVGVIVSYTGEKGADLSGDGYRHGELVANNERGVWQEPFMPGKYAFNTFAGKCIKVPTTNFILKWESGENGSEFDQNLKDISLITKDAFEPLLPMSVVVSIDYQQAPYVIQRFGDIQMLVEQTLDPMVSAFFKNIAQTKTLVELLQERMSIQADAKREMAEMFKEYNLKLQEVLIGTPRTENGESERILEQLRERQIAVEQIETYEAQRKAAGKRRELQEANAIAEAQAGLTTSNIQIEVKRNEGQADAERAIQEAKQIRTLADARAAEIQMIGEAKARAAKAQVESYGGADNLVSLEIADKFAKAIEEAKLPIVPQIVAGGDAGSSLQSLLSVFMAKKIKDE